MIDLFLKNGTLSYFFNGDSLGLSFIAIGPRIGSHRKKHVVSSTTHQKDGIAS
jgi:hypothetical protein